MNRQYFAAHGNRDMSSLLFPLLVSHNKNSLPNFLALIVIETNSEKYAGLFSKPERKHGIEEQVIRSNKKIVEA
jgi:hypothetical protein